MANGEVDEVQPERQIKQDEPLAAAPSVSQGAGTDGTSLMAEMMWVASAEASAWDTNSRENNHREAARDQR